MTDYKNLKRFEKSQINGLTKYLGSFRYGNDDRYNETIHKKAEELGLILNHDDYEAGAEVFYFKSPKKITAQQTKLGKEWLKNHFWTSKGKLRNTKNICRSVRVRAISLKVSRFEFIGVMGCKNSMGQIVQFLPIYRTYKGAAYFDYSPVHWGMPVIREEEC